MAMINAAWALHAAATVPAPACGTRGGAGGPRPGGVHAGPFQPESGPKGMPLGVFLTGLQPGHCCLSRLLAQPRRQPAISVDPSWPPPLAPRVPAALPAASRPPKPCQRHLPRVPPPAVLSWTTSAAMPWTSATRSFRPRAPCPSPRSSSTRPAAAAPSSTPTGLSAVCAWPAAVAAAATMLTWQDRAFSCRRGTQPARAPAPPHHPPWKVQATCRF